MREIRTYGDLCVAGNRRSYRGKKSWLQIWKLYTLYTFSQRGGVLVALKKMIQRISILCEGARSNGSTVDDSTRQRIVAEARRQFFSLGIRTVAMDDLAYDLGMSKTTL